MDFWEKDDKTLENNDWGLPTEAVDAASSEFRMEEPVFRSIDMLGPSPFTNPHLAAQMPSLSRASPSQFAAGSESSYHMGDNSDVLDRYEPPRLPIDMSLFPLEVTHFFTNSKPGEVVSEFAKAFSSNKVITSFNPRKFKFKCEFRIFDNKGAIVDTIQFRARIFTVNQHKKYVVELQKRQGCSVQWRKLFNDLKDTIPLERITQ